MKSDEDAEEGLSLLLGGICVSNLSSVQWDSAREPAVSGAWNVHRSISLENTDVEKVMGSLSQSSPARSDSFPHPRPKKMDGTESVNDSDVKFRHCYERASTINSAGVATNMPPVKVVDMVSPFRILKTTTPE